jgi:ABC-type glycerol-3-phosphate transport system substrate-binding protein
MPGPKAAAFLNPRTSKGDRNVKKLIALLLATAMLALSSCASGSAPAQAGNSAPASPEELSGTLTVMWLAGMTQTAVLKQMVESDFTKLYPNLKIQMDEVPNNEISQKALLEATSGASVYDVVMQAGTLPQLANINALEPLDSYIARDSFDISKMVDNGISFKGNYYGIPVRYDSFLLHYNATQFAEAGLDPDKPPTSWEEFETYGKALINSGHYGVSRGYGNNILAEAFVNTVYSLGGDICDSSNNPVYNNEIGFKALSILISELTDTKIVDQAATSWNYSEEIAGYLSGGAGMFIHYPARYVDSNNPEKSAIVGQSRVTSMFGQNVLTKGSYALIFKTSKNKDASWEFLKWLADAEVQKQVIKNGGDCNPTNLDVLNDPQMQAEYPVIAAIKGQFDRARTWPLLTQTDAIGTNMNKYMNMAATGAMGIQEALDASVADARQMLIDTGELAE